jgi:polysaccharide biosynthesis/export protein
LSDKIWMRRGTLALLLASTVLSACGLPRSAPTRREILAGSVEKQGNAFIVDVDQRVIELTDTVLQLGFPDSFRNAGTLGADTIQPGDVVGFTIFENVDQGLFNSGEGGGSSSLNQLYVDESGYIFVPYAGRIKAAGNTPESLRRVITEKLSQQTPDPQIIVQRLPGEGASVTVTGSVGGQGVFPIERSTRTLAAMIAQVGGANIDPEAVQITVIRNGVRGKIWLKDLLSTPELDIALRNGDRIFVEADPRKFTSLGATGQNVVEFEKRSISAIEAMAQMGGLNGSTADPKGIFIFRDEPEEVARAVLSDPSLQGPQRMVYVLNITSPNGVFMAREFQIHDGDTILVTEAPFAQWQKAIGAVLGAANSVNALGNVADAVNGNN